MCYCYCLHTLLHPRLLSTIPLGVVGKEAAGGGGGLDKTCPPEIRPTYLALDPSATPPLQINLWGTFWCKSN